MAEPTPQPHAAALAAFERTAALCLDHHAALDPAVRLMRSNAWVGGGAPAFTTALTQTRSALRTALTTALRSLADLVVRQGGPHPATPALTSAIPALSATPSRFQGIDPRAMTALISTLDQAATTLTSAATRLATELSSQSVAPYPAHTLARTAQWSATQSEDLRRRLTRIQQTLPGTLPAGVAAHTLFATHAPNPDATTRLLTQATTGDPAAIRTLIDLQTPGLAPRVNAWWQSLPPDIQRSLITVPAFGLLNGLPATIRDQANRQWLTAEKTRLTRAHEAATADLSRLHDPLLLGPLERTANQLRRIEFIEKSLRPVEGYPPPLLLAFDLSGQGRLIVSWGDPDSADITVTSVSGLTSGLDAAHGDLERARAIWRQADATSAGKSIASITWLGYDAPQLDPGLFDPGKSVAFENAAAKGGSALASFAEGLQASHEPSGTARSVVIGHSYGSLTTGHAAVQRPGRLADELILVGSPGVGVDHAGQLGVDPKHVWVGEAGGDPVAALGSFGTDPGRDAFGAQRFPVGRDVWTSAHSSYWNPHSASLRNMGRIINGQYDKLAPPEPLNDAPQLLMPELASDLTSKLNSR